VVDLDTGRVLGRHRAQRRLPQASTMKLLTAITATRTISPEARHRVTRYEASQICSCAGLKKGRYYSRNTLLAGMLLPSGNDAAEAVAGAHPEGRWAFYAAMNDLADRLGARDTEARNASGLTAPGSYSTARDLVILLRAALQDPTVVDILGARSAEIATITGRGRHTVWRSTDYVNRYEGSLGKSGWTTPAQNTLAVVTPIRGHRIAVATLGAPSGSSTRGARKLTRWAAANIDGLRAVGRLPRR
jgi:D-alanyl-D-alanine carboxypeptidase (penicillin-binding protein 5/6)